MKTKISTLLLCFALFSCSEDILLNDSSMLEEKYKKFSFESATDPTVWKTYNTLQEKVNACQIPEDLLKAMSTEDLLDACLNYPLYGMYAFYNDEMKGLKRFLHTFNGFQKLKRREDAAELLLNYYSDLELFPDYTPGKTNIARPNRNSSLHIGYVELMLASDEIPQLNNKENIERLEQISAEKLRAKQSIARFNSMSSLRRTLLIRSHVKQQKGIISETEKQDVDNVLNNGVGNIASERFSRVINLLK